MPIKSFDSTSQNVENLFDTSQFVLTVYLRIKYIESIFDEDIDMKNQFKNKNLLDLNSDNQPVNKRFVGDKFIDPSIIKYSAHVDVNDENLDGSFYKIKQFSSNR